eukprot:4303661-Prymnesium_polylepis.1
MPGGTTTSTTIDAMGRGGLGAGKVLECLSLIETRRVEGLGGNPSPPARCRGRLGRCGTKPKRNRCQKNKS